MPTLKKGTIIPSDEENRLINEGIAADPDAFEVTDEMFSKMRPVSEVHPNIPSRVRGPQKKPTKKTTTIRLDAEVLDFFKAQGKGWQTEVNDILHKYVDSQHTV